MFLFYVLSFFKKGDTIQGGTLIKGGHFLRKYGICFINVLCIEEYISFLNRNSCLAAQCLMSSNDFLCLFTFFYYSVQPLFKANYCFCRIRNAKKMYLCNQIFTYKKPYFSKILHYVICKISGQTEYKTCKRYLVVNRGM